MPGFDGQALLESTQDPSVKAELMANTQSAVDRGVFGIPAFFVGDEQFFGRITLRKWSGGLRTKPDHSVL